MRNFLCFFAMVILAGGKQYNKLNNSPERIDLYNAFNSKKEVYISSIVDSIEYIPLETGPDNVLSSNIFFDIANEKIIARNTDFKNSQILLFDRKSGKYIKQIASRGKGPNEFKVPALDFYNFHNNVIYAIGNNNNIISYNLDGKYLSSFQLPKWAYSASNSGTRYSGFDSFLSSEVFVSYVKNSSGLEKKKIVLFSNEKIINEFPNYLTWERKYPKVQYDFGSGRYFFHAEKFLFFKEIFNDTVFQVKQDRLIPSYVFISGKYSLEYRFQEEFLVSGKYKERFLVDNLIGSSRYIFFKLFYENINYCSFYDKKIKQAIVCNNNESLYSALIDDINGFVPLIPLKFTQNNEFICVLEAKVIKDWIDKNPIKAKDLSQKLPWLRNITELDNPVIVIAKCKK